MFANLSPTPTEAGESPVYFSMNVALRQFPAPMPASPAPADGRIARFAVFNEMSKAEAPWRALERAIESGGALVTPYQRYDFLALWQQHVGQAAGVTPFVVVGFDTAGEPMFLAPLGRRKSGPFTVVEFLGGKHVNLNFALWRRDAATSVTADDLASFVRRLAAVEKDVDVLALRNQPEHWGDTANPFALLSKQPSPSNCPRLPLGGSGAEVIERQISSSLRGRLRNKERKLQKLPGYRYLRATNAGEVDRLLAAFMVQKSARFSEKGMDNVFAEPGVEAFLRASCHQGLGAGAPVIEIHSLVTDEEVLALYAGVNDGKRFSGMFNSYTLSENARWSPGLILLLHMVTDCADRNLGMFDLGIGEAHYKELICPSNEKLFDSFMGLTPRGSLIVFAMQTALRVKRAIKHNRLLWSVVLSVRWTRALFSKAQ